MRILFVSAWFPCPPDNGSRIRAYNLMKALARKHEVYLVSLLQEDSRRENSVGLEGICKVVSLHESKWFKPGSVRAALGYLSSRPRSCVDTYDPAVRSAVDEAIEQVKPDVIAASTLGVVEYIPHNIPTVLEQHNCEFAVLKRAMEGMDGKLARLRAEVRWRKFARWEIKVCRSFGAVVMVSEGDKELLLEAAPELDNVHVVLNGVDTEHYTANSRHPEKNTLLYNGALTYGANLDAVRYFAGDIYPIVSRALPDVKLRVTGRSNGVDLTGISDCPGVELTGYVDDIRDELAKAEICLVTLRQGGGSRLKILEAMAAGTPVVSTSVGIEGIEAEDGRHALIADTPEEIAAAIRRLLEDESLQASLSRNARALVEAQYSWTAIGEGFVRVVEQVAGGRRGY